MRRVFANGLVARGHQRPARTAAVIWPKNRPGRRAWSCNTMAR